MSKLSFTRKKNQYARSLSKKQYSMSYMKKMSFVGGNTNAKLSRRQKLPATCLTKKIRTEQFSRGKSVSREKNIQNTGFTKRKRKI